MRVSKKAGTFQSAAKSDQVRWGCVGGIGHGIAHLDWWEVKEEAVFRSSWVGLLLHW